LRERGAIVTGIDKSAGMLGVARRRLGEDADLLVAELGRPLHFPDDTFDDVTASLVLHTWRTGGRPSPSCGACSSPADGSSCQLTIPL
jgi:SAM-dependent methyltransferase